MPVNDLIVGTGELIPTNRWPASLRFVVVFATTIVIGVVIIDQLVSGIGIGKWGISLPLSFSVGVYALAVGFAALVISVEWVRTTKYVRLDSSGIFINYPLRSVDLPWREMMRITGVGMGVVVFCPLSTNPDRLGGAYSITIRQARAILENPRCPPVNMPDHFRRSIMGQDFH